MSEITSTFKPAPIKPVVGFPVLEALDIRIGTIQKVEEVARSEKLMKLTVSFGDHTRTILAGTKKERENPREIEGMQALFVVNLEPRKMAGEISEGMLFDIGYADGVTPGLAMPEKPGPAGPPAGRGLGGCGYLECRAAAAPFGNDCLCPQVDVALVPPPDKPERWFRRR